MYVSRIILLFIVILFNISCSTHDSNAVNEIIEKLKSTEAQLVSAKGSFIHEHIHPHRIQNNSYVDTVIQNGELFTKDELLDKIPFGVDIHGKEKVNFAFQHDKTSIEIVDLSEKLHQPYFRTTFDGKKRYGLANKRDMSDFSVVLLRGGISSDAEMPLPELNDYDPRYTFLTLSSRPISKTLEYARNKRNCSVEIAGHENIDQLECIVIKVHLEIKKFTEDIMLWLSLENNYLPIKIHKISPNTDSLTKITYIRYNKDICFPSHIVIDRHYRGKYSKHSVLTFNNNWEINTTIADSLFVISFPKGISILDHTTGKRYIQE